MAFDIMVGSSRVIYQCSLAGQFLSGMTKIPAFDVSLVQTCQPHKADIHE
jgi:hypothetical protein